MEPYSIWSFCDWLISLRTTSLTQGLSLLLCVAEFLCTGWIVFHRMHRPHGGCFYIFAAVNSAAMNGCVNTAFISRFQFLWQIPRNRTAWLHESSIFNFLRSLHTVFHAAAPCIPARCSRVPISLYPHQHVVWCRCCFWYQPSWQMWGDIILWSWFAFPWWLVTLSNFSYTYRSLAYLLWRNSSREPIQILDY